MHQPNLQRLTDQTDGAIIIKELREALADSGHQVSYTSLRDWARSRPEGPDAPAPATAAPSVYTVVGWITRHPDTAPKKKAPGSMLFATPVLS
ncbi:hypothetical protein [Streptomyces avermitilis]|uniref:hypothetical protein n=1 Tax=Streptomyces avermitilis TaxID=33903 RepID=UPI003808259C